MRKSRIGRAKSIGLLSVALATAALVGGAVVALIPERLPASVEPPARPKTLPIVLQPYDDPRTVSFSVQPGAEASLFSPAAGLVSSFECVPGAMLRSGEAIIHVEGSPLVAFSTSEPLWRDFVAGDTGADVLAAQRELERLGYALHADGRYGAATAAALAKFMKSAGIVNPDPAKVRASVVWLPAPVSRATTCEAQIGQRLRDDERLASVSDAVLSAKVAQLPDGAVLGPRVLRYKGRSIPITESGIASPIAAELLPPRSAKAAEGNEESPEEQSGTAALAAPIQVASVTPSAVFGLDGQEGCLLSGNRIVPVTVVGSALGQTFVRFKVAKVPDVINLDPDSHRRCA
ncbi:peptidoglycan-binding protein [Leifsonia sp. fls2-241-R2A-40a]|uniref:peptidoglycan-binding domain-containing protein n=1 Tax=Leifsonia sp. fls2-241-R2A-40a TaxID=3040290 RepID=UPI00254E28FB|nr:peptidoglycan-binding protein [Leifsonia sp. fls2-241-R2A-40a]